MIINVAIPGDIRVRDKEIEKIKKYRPLKHEIAPDGENQEVKCHSCSCWSIGAITTRFEKFVEDNGVDIRVEHAQKTALFFILRLVLGC